MTFSPKIETVHNFPVFLSPSIITKGPFVICSAKLSFVIFALQLFFDVIIASQATENDKVLPETTTFNVIKADISTTVEFERNFGHTQ